METPTSFLENFTQSVNTIFSNFFCSVDSNFYYILDDIIFIDSDILNDTLFNKIIGTSAGSRITSFVQFTYIWFCYILFNFFIII